MFGFGKTTPCQEMDLLGYLLQATGGAWNLAQMTGSPFTANKIMSSFELAVTERSRSLSKEQRNRVIKAANIVEDAYPLSSIREDVQRFAEMMRGGNFNFFDPSVNKFRETLKNHGVSFYF